MLWAIIKCCRYIYANRQVKRQSFYYGVTGSNIF
nr:hypothetical protein [Klebsiella sp. RIT-PI-d]